MLKRTQPFAVEVVLISIDATLSEQTHVVLIQLF